MSKPRTSRHLPIKDRVTECEAALKKAYETSRKVDQLIAIERLLDAKRKIGHL